MSMHQTTYKLLQICLFYSARERNQVYLSAMYTILLPTPPPPQGVAPWSISSPVPHRNLENRYSEVEFYLRPILPPQIANKDLLK